MNKRFMCLAHGGVILPQQPRLGQPFRNFVAVDMGERLQDLNAAAMAVHIAEATDVHQDVKAQSLPGRELAQQFIMPSALLRAEGDDLVAALLLECADRSRELAI